MAHTRIRWRNVARLAAATGVAALLVALVAATMAPDPPEPLPQDVGLGGFDGRAMAYSPPRDRPPRGAEPVERAPKPPQPDRDASNSRQEPPAGRPANDVVDTPPPAASPPPTPSPPAAPAPTPPPAPPPPSEPPAPNPAPQPPEPEPKPPVHTSQFGFER